jgi:hypothetical protein
MDLEKQINLLLSYEGSKKNWRNVHDSKEWILANKIASVIMGETLNKKPNCGCLNDLFYMLKNISKSKIKLKQLQMENEFELKPGILLFLNGTHYTNANITDEKSIEILTKFPVKIDAFIRFPKKWKDLTKGTETEAPKTEDSKELEDLSKEELRTLCDTLAEQTEGLRKLNHKAGTDKMIDYLLKNKVNG